MKVSTKTLIFYRFDGRDEPCRIARRAPSHPKIFLLVPKSGVFSRTMIAMPAISISPPSVRRPQTTFHPCSLFCLPPMMMTAKAIIEAIWMMTAKLMRKLTLRQSEQKSRLVPEQSDSLGNGTQVPVKEEHFEWRPYE